MFDKKRLEKQIIALVAYDKFLCELLGIVMNEHPEIMTKAIIQTVEKNPELFKKE